MRSEIVQPVGPAAGELEAGPGFADQRKAALGQLQRTCMAMLGNLGGRAASR